MRFSALAFCLAGTVIAAVPAAAQHDDHKMGRNDRSRTMTTRSMNESDMCITCGRSHAMYDTVTGASYHAGSHLYMRDMLYTDMVPESQVASRVTEIIEMQRREAAELRAMAPRAQTAGFQNISMVYDHMAADHTRLADFASTWLRQRDFRVPAESAATTAANMSPEASVDHHIQMHTDAFNRNLSAREGERSSTVRGMRLWAAATAARHLSILRTLDRDVEFGRRTASARLQSMIDGNYMASDQTALMTRIYEEEAEIFRTFNTAPIVVAEQPMQVVEVERVVERIVERPVERVVERIVERPVDRIVERPAPTRSTVAGRRQTTRQRRPAK